MESNLYFPCSITRAEGKKVYFPRAKASNPKGTETMQYIIPSMENRKAVSCIFSVIWLAGDVKEPTHLSKRVGNISRCCGLALSHGLVLHVGLTSLHLSPLDRDVQEKIL